MNPNLSIGILTALAAALIGSSWQIVSRYGVTTSLGPLELACLRYGVPALVLVPICWRVGLLPKALPKLRLALIVLGGLPFGVLVMAGLQWAPAAHLGIFGSGSVPLFAALGAWWFFGERLGGLRLFGLLLIAAGLLSLGAHSLQSGVGGTWLGDVLFLVAAALWAAYTLAFRGSGLTAWQGAALINAWSAILLLPAVLIWGVPKFLTAPALDIAGQALGQGVLAGLLGLVTYMAAIAHLGAARAALSASLVPLLTALGAAWLLKEPLGLATIVATALVVLGTGLAAWGTGAAPGAKR
jgi:drug/metabolite transporter (DMT)-like permease